MTLPQVYELFQYWTRNPPVHELAAAYLGWKAPEESEAAKPMGPEEFAAWVKRTAGKEFGPGVG